VLISFKTETEPISEMFCFFIKLKKIVLSFVYTWWFGDAGLSLAPHGLTQNVWFGVVWFSPSHANLRLPHTFKNQINGKNLVLHSGKYNTLW